VETRQTFAERIRRPGTVAFLDEPTLRVTGDLGWAAPVVAVLECPLARAVKWMRRYPWLHHVVSASALDEEGSQYLGPLVRKLGARKPIDLQTLVGAPLTGRAAQLNRARLRSRRLERMSDFLAAHGFGGRHAVLACDLAEEMLSNAFYDAPAEAGVIPRPVSRLSDIVLPTPCEIAYGVGEGVAFVRVRDVFGSLRRARMMEVLERCAREAMSVEPDESRGGAGLGLWRIFSTASVLSINVLGGKLTEVLVGIRRRHPRTAKKVRPYAFHLHFDGEEAVAPTIDELPELDRSVTLVG
jgi:hypothetical protein